MLAELASSQGVAVPKALQLPYPCRFAVQIRGIRVTRFSRFRCSSCGSEPRREGQVELEVEARPMARRRLHLHLPTHARDELSADRQAEPRTRERELPGLHAAAERVEQRRQYLHGNASAGVLHGELQARLRDRPAGHLDVALRGELQCVRREVEEHTVERDRMTDAPIRV